MDKKPNIKNVAELAGVSISTVSRVLNRTAGVSDELREKVDKAIEDTGYSINPIASTLKSTRRNQMAIVIPSLRQTYYTDIIKGISDFCYEHDLLPVILESSGELEKEQKIIDNLEKQWVDGIIFIPSKNREQKDYREFAERLSRLSKNRENIPVILMESNRLNDKLDCVSADYQYAFSMLATHMQEIGRKRIAYLGTSKDASMYELSLSGIRSSLQENGNALPDQYVKDSGYTVLDGYRAMNELLEQRIIIDGVICANDQMAAGALQACCERGLRVPQDIALTGFGGVALSIITAPSITTMIVPRYEMGYKAAGLLFERICGKKDPAEMILTKPHLAIRGSTLKTASKKLDLMFGE